jgi:hypothetical protein
MADLLKANEVIFPNDRGWPMHEPLRGLVLLSM